MFFFRAKIRAVFFRCAGGAFRLCPAPLYSHAGRIAWLKAYAVTIAAGLCFLPNPHGSSDAAAGCAGYGMQYGIGFAPA